MPKAPDLPLAANLAYIGNYFIAGCTPPMYIFFDFVKEPTADLIMLFLLPDLQDVVQGIVDPRGRRSRSPGRHGRKPPERNNNRRNRKGQGGGVPDISEMIAGELRGTLNPNNALNFSAARKAFKLLNIYERIAFTYAVIDGISDIAFANFYGLATVRPGDCQDFARFDRSHPGVQGLPGILGPTPQAQLPILNFETGITTSSIGWIPGNRNVSAVFQGYVTNDMLVSSQEVAAVLRSVTTGQKVVGSASNLAPGEGAWCEVSATFEPGEIVVWEYERTGGNMTAFGQTCTGFADLPPPPSWLGG